MSIPFSNTHHRIPRGFGNLLEGLTREILRDQPKDIPVFAAAYFADLLKQREESNFDPVEWGAKLEDRFYNNGAFKQPQPSRSKEESRELATLEATRDISGRTQSEQNLDENSQNDSVPVSRLLPGSVALGQKEQTVDVNDVIKKEYATIIQANGKEYIARKDEKTKEGTDTESQFIPSGGPEVDILVAEIDEMKLKDYVLPLEEDQNTTAELGIFEENHKESFALGLHLGNAYDNSHSVEDNLEMCSTEQEMSQAEENSTVQHFESLEDGIESMARFREDPMNNNNSASENVDDHDTNSDIEITAEITTEQNKEGIEAEHTEKYDESITDLQEDRRTGELGEEHIQEAAEIKEHDDAEFEHHKPIIHEFQATEIEQEEAEIPIGNEGDNEFPVIADRNTKDDEINVENLQEITNDGSEVTTTQEKANLDIETAEEQEQYATENDDENQTYPVKEHIAVDYLETSHERFESLHESEDVSQGGQNAQEKGEENGTGETVNKQEEDVLDIPLDNPDANAAAAKIQAGFRGHMTRKKIKGGEIDVKHKEASSASVAAAVEKED